jgi:2-succinyl-6-hydroxy-2,4-cyclohexadiene-1-carboxylate synthase
MHTGRRIGGRAMSTPYPLVAGMQATSAQSDGLNWHILRAVQASELPPLVLLHGFGGDSQAWASIASSLAPREIWAPDLPGHGATTPLTPAGDWSLARVADSLAAILPTRFDLAGYSLGGRLALALALRHPQRVSRLALVGASAGLLDPQERAARRASDQHWATVLLEDGLAHFFTAWDAQPLFATRDGNQHVQAELQRRRDRQTAAGLAWSLTAFGPGSEPALHAMISMLEVPTLWVAGQQDPKYVAIARDAAATMPQADFATVAACGHDVLTECPNALADIFSNFFASADRQFVAP